MVTPRIPVSHLINWQSMGWSEIIARVIRDGEENSLGPVVWDAEQLGDFFFLKQVDCGPSRSEATRAQRQHEAPCGREDRSVRAGLGNHHWDGLDSTFDAGNDMHGDLLENLSQILSRLHDFGHDVFARVTRFERWRISRARHDFSALAICVGNSLALGGISDHHECPVLRIGSGRGLHGDFNTFLHDLWLNGTAEVQSFSHRASGGEEFVC